MNLNFEKKFWKSGYINICGVDEAGRGPLAGPVVAAAVLYNKKSLTSSFNKSVNDSKKVSEKNRLILFEHIMNSADSVGVGIVDQKIIDKINILEATKLAIKNALQKLKIEPEIVLVDGNFYSHPKYKVMNVVKGDARSYIIACASIIAKVTRDKIMIENDKKFPVFGFQKHKGYGTANHINAIKNYGLSPLHRKSFKIRELNV
ncbi:MAG: ribonuclease HII [Bacteroidetes bacterium]|nr:ribonuclease HII [Bacteroidota bacterium]